MDHSPFKQASSFMESDSHDLRSLMIKVKALKELNLKISPYLQPSLARYCEVAKLTGGTLTLIVANASVATQIRYQSADLIMKFRQDDFLKHIYRIECKVRLMTQTSHLNKETQPQPCIAPITPKTAAIIREIADSIADSQLKKIMEDIAEHVKKE